MPHEKPAHLQEPPPRCPFCGNLLILNEERARGYCSAACHQAHQFDIDEALEWATRADAHSDPTPPEL